MVVAAPVARCRCRLLLRRLVIELPFLAFAVLLPIVGSGPRVDVLGVSLSEPASGGRGTSSSRGRSASPPSFLAATTPIPDILRGLDRLHVPARFITIAGFMVRYLDVIAGEMRRMRIARLSRGHDPRWIWQARRWPRRRHPFIRSYERGERVYLAMLRGASRHDARADRADRVAAGWARRAVRAARCRHRGPGNRVVRP